MNSLIQLEIPRRKSLCSGQGEQLAPGMEIYSLLHEEESDRYERSDFCSVCWNQIQKEEAEKKPRIYWKSKIEEKRIGKSSQRLERALALLREMLQSQDAKEEEVFVLCLYLSHSRQIALRQEFLKEGVSYQIYEILRQEEFLTIKTIKLSHLQIDEIQASLAEKLQFEKIGSLP